MPDRRQHDRRESNGKNNKSITISFTTFVYVIIIISIIIISAIVCIIVSNVSYNKGYEHGIIDSQYSFSDDIEYTDDENATENYEQSES